MADTSVKQVPVHDATGKSAGTIELDGAWFGVEPHVAVMHQVVTAQLAARRAGTQSTKTRAEVRGGGAKPWRQKGTGRARQGSTRAPHWQGGGVALGPKPRSYAQRTPKKMMIRLALLSALSDRAADGKVLVVDAWGFDGPSTKGAAGLLRTLGASGRVLVVVSPLDVDASKSFRNIPEVHVCLVGELNAYDVLVSDFVVLLPVSTLPTSGAGAATPTVEAPAPGGHPRGRHDPDRERRGPGHRRRGHRRWGRHRHAERGGGRLMDPRDVVIRPVVSEKSYALNDTGAYTFVVHPDANKIQIRQAVESIFGVRVLKVNTLNRPGKRKRNRRSPTFGKRSDTKRAIVTLIGDDRIELFES